MKPYQLEICKAIQHDICELGGKKDEWDIETVYNFWKAWSNELCAGFLGYKQGDFQQLEWAINMMYDEELDEE